MRRSSAASTWIAEDLVRRHARAPGAGPALVGEDGALTWLELDRAVDAAATSLSAAGLVPGRRLALRADPVLLAVTILLAAHRLGASVALLPPGSMPAEDAAALDVVLPDVLVLDLVAWSHATAAVAAAAGHGPGSVRSALAVAPTGPRPRPAAGPDDPAVVLLTSGTTGHPKGVVLSQRALAASADAWIETTPPATGWLLCVGLAHVAGIGVVWRAIRAAAPIRLAGPADPVAQLAALRRSSGGPPVSHLSVVPAQLGRLLDAAGSEPVSSDLRAVLLGGGSIPPALVTRATALGWPVIPTYGLSEAGSGVTALLPAEAATHPGSAGRPLPGVTVRILDPGPDGLGEIEVSTPAAFSGYAGEAPRDASEPVRTGDLGRLDEDGRLQVLDRRLDRIVRGGENISPAEVEGVLEQHPGVAEAAVVARPDRTWGQVPVAAIVAATSGGAAAPRSGLRETGAGRHPTLGELQAWCRERLSGFKVPVAVVYLDVLPRTGSGKLRREAVRALVDGSPSGILARPGGDWIGWRVTARPSATARSDPTNPADPAILPDPTNPADPAILPVILLPGTLSTARQLDRLAAELAGDGALAVHALDRRGIGSSRLASPEPLDITVHVDDLRAYLDAREIAAAALVGHSFGGVLALEAAARLPGRVLSVVAYEPPYGPLADDVTRDRFARTASLTAEAYRAGGPALAAETFLRIVAGDAAWTSLPERSRAWLAREGLGAVTDSALAGLDPDGLARIHVPVRILGGGASLPFYPLIAAGLVDRIAGASRAQLPGLNHNGPITDPVPVAAAVRACLAEGGIGPGGPPRELRR